MGRFSWQHGQRWNPGRVGSVTTPGPTYTTVEQREIPHRPVGFTHHLDLGRKPVQQTPQPEPEPQPEAPALPPVSLYTRVVRLIGRWQS